MAVELALSPELGSGPASCKALLLLLRKGDAIAQPDAQMLSALTCVHSTPCPRPSRPGSVLYETQPLPCLTACDRPVCVMHPSNRRPQPRTHGLCWGVAGTLEPPKRERKRVVNYAENEYYRNAMKVCYSSTPSGNHAASTACHSFCHTCQSCAAPWCTATNPLVARHPGMAHARRATHGERSAVYNSVACILASPRQA